jgi:hypothetical protein
MKTSTRFLLIVTLIIAGLSNDVFATSYEAIILHCSAFAGDPGHLTSKVVAVSSSSGAPVIDVNTNCAQVLADIFSTGFIIQNTQGTDSGVIYTLVKKSRN